MSDGTLVVSEFYRFHRPKAQYQQTIGFGGTLVREGPSVSWSRDGQKIEEGSYRNGKRDGEWTFWNEDGSIDPCDQGSTRTMSVSRKAHGLLATDRWGEKTAPRGRAQSVSRWPAASRAPRLSRRR
jgi:hypothetical protein